MPFSFTIDKYAMPASAEHAWFLEFGPMRVAAKSFVEYDRAVAKWATPPSEVNEIARHNLIKRGNYMAYVFWFPS
jgi:hypothetical protein